MTGIKKDILKAARLIASLLCFFAVWRPVRALQRLAFVVNCN